MGIRGEDDDRQIRRWQDFAGTNGRWRNRLYKRIEQEDDWSISPRIQQSLLHWGYKANEEDYSMYKQFKLVKDEDRLITQRMGL